MKKRVLILFVFSSLVLNNIFAQNLVRNSSFETNSSIPFGLKEWYKCVNWTNLNYTNTITLNNGTPDYFHEESNGVAKLPNSFYGSITPHSGKAVVGFISTYDPVLLAGTTLEYFREYWSCELASELIVGGFYNVSFWISNGDSLIINEYKTDGIGLCLSTSQLHQYGTAIPDGDVTPQYQIDYELWTTEWKKIEFVLYADSAYKFLTIGNFYKNNEMSLSQEIPTTNGYGGGAYYFLDDVVVKPFDLIVDTICYGDSIELKTYNVGTTSWRNKEEPFIEISTESNLIVNPNNTSSYILISDSVTFETTVIVNACSELIMPNVFTPNSDLINDVFTPYYIYNVGKLHIQIYNRWGNLVYETNDLSINWTGECLEGDCTDGVYFWVVNYEDVFGKPFSKQGTVHLFR